MSYCKLTTAELQAEQVKQHEIAQGASPDNSLDEMQKLFVIESMLAYRESHADRLKRQPAKKAKAPVKDRQVGVFARPGRVTVGEKPRILFGKAGKNSPAAH
jgi:hypothetical protein